VLCLAGCLLIAAQGHAQQTETGLAVLTLGGPAYQGWSGFVDAAEGKMAVPGTVAFRYPDGPRGVYHHGFRVVNDSAEDWSGFYGVRYTVDLPDDREVELVTTVRPTVGDEAATGVPAVTRLAGKGEHTVTLPWSAFDFAHARTSFLQAVKTLTVAARYSDGGVAGQITLRWAEAIKAPSVYIETPIRGKSVPGGRSAEYVVQVANTTDKEEAVTLSFVRRGWR
jgi:hypothetical protein